LIFVAASLYFTGSPSLASWYANLCQDVQTIVLEVEPFDAINKLTTKFMTRRSFQSAVFCFCWAVRMMDSSSELPKTNAFHAKGSAQQDRDAARVGKPHADMC
jgi:hypothetical protein